MVKKNDFILIGILAILCAVLCLGIFLFKKDGKVVTVSVDSVTVAEFTLDENREYEIEGYAGGRNTLVIVDGEAYLIDSSCPDHLCENMGKISKVGQSIICLPNRVVVEIRGSSDKAEYDAISS